ncbi:glycosyltransferase [Pyrobaculum sp.]|uniref:glycosyltransferase n=1 Tax=Pyrobaculum sp. TaxID=2004705 RepID=UPI00317193B4
MSAVIFVRSVRGTGFYEVGRAIAHVLNIEMTNNPARLLHYKTIIFVDSIYGSLTPLLLSKTFGKKTVLYITAEGPFNPGVRKLLVGKRSFVATPSKYSAMELLNQDMVVHKVIPHGIDTCELPQVNGHSSKPYVEILSIVGDEVYKILGATHLLRAYARSRYLINNSRLILKISPGKMEYFKKLLINLGIHNNVTLIPGYLTKKELYYLMGKADIYVHVSLSDAFGLPIIESMAMGTLAVVLNAPPWNEIVNENIGYLVRIRGEVVLNHKPPYRVRIPDIQDLSKILEDAVSQVSPSLYKKVRDYVINKFNAHILYKTFQTLIET